MTLTQQSPPATETKPPKPLVPVESSGPSIKSVLVGAAGVVGVVGGVVVFVAGGWWVLGGTALAAGAAGLTVAKVRSKRPHKTRPGALHSWLTRSRRTSTARASKGMGSLPWSLTGNQSKRARTGHGPKVRRPGTGGPALTGKGRARRASVAASGKAPAKSIPGARPVAKKTPGARPAPLGTGGRRTPTKTPARPSTRSPLTPSRKPASAAGKGTPRPRLATAKRATSRPISNGGKGATILPFKRPAKKTTGTTPAPRKTTAAPRRTGGLPKVTGRNPLGRTGGAKRLGRRTGAGLTKRARRLGTPKVRRHPARPGVDVNRTTKRPTPRTRRTTGQLLRAATRLPRRTGRFRFRRPSKAAQTRAKRLLWARSRIAGRRALTAPWRGLKAAWGHRDVFRPWYRLPAPIDPAWRTPNVPDPAPRRTRRKAAPVPQLTARRAPAGNPTTKGPTVYSNPVETITEAFAQLANFDTENAREIEAFLGSLHQIGESAGSSISALAERWADSQPLDPAVPAGLSEFAALFTGAAGVAEEVNNTFRTVHEPELTRLDEPRANERAWDVTLND